MKFVTTLHQVLLLQLRDHLLMSFGLNEIVKASEISHSEEDVDKRQHYSYFQILYFEDGIVIKQLKTQRAPDVPFLSRWI